MHPRRDNLYKAARKAANLSREMAAELLGTSARSLSDYEQGVTKAPCDLVLHMAEVYRDRALVYRHMSEVCPVGRQILPPEQSVAIMAARIIAGMLKKRTPDAANNGNSARRRLAKVLASD